MGVATSSRAVDVLRTGNSEIRGRQSGVAAFAHPLCIAALAGWLLNDHLLKGIYGNWITGKFGDLCAMIVFPLVVAVLIESRVRRSIVVGITVTAAFYSAINLLAPADAATESLLRSLGLRSGLTQDPTDLFTLPALFGAWWVWRRATASEALESSDRLGWRSTLRRVTERVAFGAAIFTTMATSAPEPPPSTQAHGDIVLTAAEPQVTIPFNVKRVGDSAPLEKFVSARWDATFFGSAGDQTLENEISVSITDLGGGRGQVAYRLDDVTLAPAAVAWTLIARGASSGDDPPKLRATPVSTVSSDLAEPVVSTDWRGQSEDAGQEILVTEWQLTTLNDAATILLAPPIADGLGESVGYGGIRAATAESHLVLTPGRPVPVPVPSDCGSTGCSFSVWLRTVGWWRDVYPSDISLYANNGVTVAPVSHDVITTNREIMTTPVRLGPDRLSETYDLVVTVPGAANPIEEITRLVSIHDSADTTGDDYVSGVRSELDPNPDGLTWHHPLPVTDCCPTQVRLNWEPREDDRDAEREIEAQVTVTVEYSSLEPADDGSFAVRIGP